MATRSGPDAGLRKLLRDNLGRDRGFWWQAIETGATSAGLPDSHVLHDATGTLWVESKKTDGFAVKFEPHQLQWWRKHAPWVRGFIAVRTLGVGSSGGTGDGLALYAGADADALSLGGVESVGSIIRFRGPPKTWNWRALAIELTRPKGPS
jgi:hypothetical protein